MPSEFYSAFEWERCLAQQVVVGTRDIWVYYMSYSLNSLKGGYIGDYIGDYYRGY